MAQSVAASRPTPKSHAQDPRTYQLSQLRKRFAAGAQHRYREVDVKSDDGSVPATCLTFRLPPSDPDFAFDLDYLEVELRVPPSYPPAAEAARQVQSEDDPVIRASAPGLPRGFCVNVERGWDGLVSEAKNKGNGVNLLWLVNALDRNLERFLAEKSKVETVTLVSFKGASQSTTCVVVESPPDKPPSPTPTPIPSAPAPAPALALAPPPAALSKPYVPRESYTREQMVAARSRRAAETRQVETRMSRMTGYLRSSDGVIYTLPLQPQRRSALPGELQGVQSVNIIVPLLYPLQKLGAQLSGVGVDARLAEDVEAIFERKVAEAEARQEDETEHEEQGGHVTVPPRLTIMGWVNYLAQNLHVLAREAEAAASSSSSAAAAAAASESVSSASTKGIKDASDSDAPSRNNDGHKSHIQLIPRPPEWVLVTGEESSDDHADSCSSEEEEDDDDDDGDNIIANNPPQAVAAHPPAVPAERAFTLTFPSISLLGIDLLELAVLALGLKCDRCRTQNDVSGLADLGQKTGSCRKCTKDYAVTWRKEIGMHASSCSAGTVEVVGCTPGAVLTSTFVPLCAKCDSRAGNFNTVPGERLANVCRACHARITLALPLPGFLPTTPGSQVAVVPAGPAHPHPHSHSHPREPQLKGGSPLPANGTCGHYKRSYRWFRFSCCGHVHACDRCHQVSEDHAADRADRMVCGWCSREQRYAADSCRFCGRGVVGRSGGRTGFWEGGRGTRDKKLMSRKEGRKWKRAGGGAVAAEAARKRIGD